MKLIFAGDSITDADHLWTLENHGLGDGYVGMIYQYFVEKGLNHTILNRGTNGFEVHDLKRIWMKKCIAENPDVLTILIGVNDIGAHKYSGRPLELKEIETDYRFLLDTAREKTEARLILMEPFVFEYPREFVTWKEPLGKVRGLVKSLSEEYATDFVPLDGILKNALKKYSFEELTIDGIHVTQLGHRIIGDSWMKSFSSHKRGD